MNQTAAALPVLREQMGGVEFDIFQNYVDELSVAAGENVVSEGEIMDYGFFVLQGRLSVVLDDGAGRQIPLRSATPGRWFGQTSFLTPTASLLTITASEPSVVGRITAESFARMSESYLGAADALLRSISLEISNRMRGAGKSLFKRFAWDQVEGSEGEEAAQTWFTKVLDEMNGVDFKGKTK